MATVPRSAFAHNLVAFVWLRLWRIMIICFCMPCINLLTYLFYLLTYLQPMNRILWYYRNYKKLSYPQRKRASNMTLLYGAKGISIWNPHGLRVWQYRCAICRINTKQVRNLQSCGASNSFRSVFNTLVRGEPLNSGPRHLTSSN